MKRSFQRYPLAERVLDALPKIGYHRPTPVQEAVIPLILQRRNVIVEAATGTGKTAAYGLPHISRLDLLKRSTQVLVVVPSRELALQVETALKTFSTHDSLRIGAIYGGMSLAASEEVLRSSPHIMVAVPGRLKDVLRTGKHDHFWRDIKYLVIDEADKLLEFGFQKILDNIVSHLRNMVQVACFSATISGDVEELIRDRFYPIQSVRLSPREALVNISFNYIMVDRGRKPHYLAGLINQRKIRQALIFCSTRNEVYELANFLRSVGRRAQDYHGLLDQVERSAVMKRFKAGQVEFLVATDLAARGLDVEKLPAVINYSFPEDIEVYLHRCGRTGRMHEKGAVYNLVASKKEEILVQSFHEELRIGLKQFGVKPVTKEAIRVANDRVIKAHFNRGKRDKVRAGDVLGFLVNATGLASEEIGTIAVYDSYSLVDIPESAFEVLEMLEETKVKGKNVKITRYTLADQKKKSEAVKKRQYGVRDKKQQELKRESRNKKS